MPEKNSSRSLEDDSGRRTTGLVEMGGRPGRLFAQSSVLSTPSLSAGQNTIGEAGIFEPLDCDLLG
jgi:hypothetical protein